MILRCLIVSLTILTISCSSTGEILTSPSTVQLTSTSGQQISQLELMALQLCSDLDNGRTLFQIASELVQKINDDSLLRSRSDIAVFIANAIGTNCLQYQDDLDLLLSEGLPRT